MHGGSGLHREIGAMVFSCRMAGARRTAGCLNECAGPQSGQFEAKGER
jgi:hypothetical protein